MKTELKCLPPTWVKVFSCLFLIYLVIPIVVIWQIRDIGTQMGSSAFGLNLRGDRHPISWILAVDSVLFLGGVTGLLIVTRKRFAYGFGIFYCVYTMLVTGAGQFVVASNDPGRWIGVAVQYPMLVLFLMHLLRYRHDWIEQTSEAGATDGGEPPD